MKTRSSAALIFASLLVLWGGCVDTVQPTEPVPGPTDDSGGEITAPAAVDADAEDMSLTATRRALRPTR